MEKQEYYIGLDCGTDSVGWAVVKPDYTVVKKAGKSLWGVRLFDEGQPAAERRASRSTRRRTDRRKWRLKLLKEIFNSEISAVDPAFFARLNESKYWEDDKKVDGADSLFHDADFTDRDYHKKFPTIYHLRSYLMNCTEKPDIRLVYLALAHIIKNRGHFLNEGKSLDEARSFDSVWDNFCTSCENVLEISLPSDIKEEVANTLKDGNIKVKESTKILTAAFGTDEEKTAVIKAVATLLSGGKVSFKDLFDDEELTDKVSFKEKDFETIEAEFSSVLGDERCEFLHYAYSAYSWGIFAQIIPEGKTFSQVKIEEYNKHAKDLKTLKSLVRQYCPQKYFSVFRSTKVKDNYASYVGSTNYGKGKTSVNRCNQQSFYAFLKKELSELWKIDDEKVKAVFDEIENGTFMPRPVGSENSLIPYQLHLQELKAILKNMQQFYPFFLEEDENGYTAAYKIEKLLTFRIPYYVGPLNDAHKDKGFCWIEKKIDVPVLPWNYDKVVDENKSENNFIERMTSTCTYLVGENVLPKNSILYCKFMVLNELNNLCVRDEKISVELKQGIFNELFNKGTGSKVTLKKVCDYLKQHDMDITKDDITGIDGDFKSSMSPVLKLKAAFENVPDDDTLEELIYSLTVSGDSPKMVKRRIKNVLGADAPDLLVNRISNIKFAGWGRLSAKFLTEIYDVDAVTGECRNIMDALWNTNENLMQLLSNKYSFIDKIKEYNEEQNDNSTKFDYDHTVKDLYVSPAVKRGLWQTLLVVKELRKIMGCDPTRVFIEMARGASPEQKNKRTVSRKTRLLQLYENCKDETRDWHSEIDALPEDKFRSDKLYLYYTQMGRCMYSGEPIDLETLMLEGDSPNRLYDIDHIYPQSKTKDDSLDNRVLVKRTLNAAKTDVYPIPSNMRQSKLWYMLYGRELISKKKYERLTRNIPLTDEELAGFINRQLVETRQSTKAAAQLLDKLLPQTEMVYVKAGLVSDFRQNFDFVKSRDINDFHHAKDAYLNVVVGNVYHEKFTNNYLKFIHSGSEYSLNIDALFKKWDVVKGERVIWKKGKDGSIKTVQERMTKNDPLVTRLCTEQKGKLFNANPLKQGSGQFPLKNDERLKDISRYGGYDKVKGAYFALVAYEKKGKIQKSIEAVPLYLMTELKKNPEFLKEYFQKQLDVNELKVLIPEIKIGTLFKWNGFPITLAGRSGNKILFRGAAQWRATPEQEKYVKKISKYIERSKGRKDELKIIPEYDKLTKEENLELYDRFTELLQNGIYAIKLSKQGQFLKDSRDKFISLSLESQVKQLFEILHLFQCKSGAADLRLLKEVNKSDDKSDNNSGNAGIITYSKNLSEKNKISIIHQSVTGFFTKEVSLNSL